MSNFFKNKKVVVTGGSGFIGSHFLNELVKRGAIVKTHTFKSPLQVDNENIEVVENIDLTNLEDCIKLIEGAEYVIHCGGAVAHPSTVPTDVQISLAQLNLIGNVLEACAKTKVKRFLDLNSSTGYPDIRRPLTEDEFWVDNFNLETCHVVPALIKRHLSGENPFNVWGSPDVVRDFLYVKDVVNGALLILEKGESMRPYNLGYGSGVTIGDIVDTILKVTGNTPEVIWDNSKPTIPFRAVSTDRIQNELGFKPTYSFEEGMKETINWYKKDKL